MHVLGIFKTENKIDTYVVADAENRAVKIISKEDLCKLVNKGLIKPVVNDKGTLRIKLSLKSKIALKVAGQSVKNGLTLDEYIGRYGAVFKTKHAEGIKYNFLVGTIVSISDIKINGHIEHMVSSIFLGTLNAIAEFESRINRIMNMSYTKIINKGEQCILVCPIAEFLDLAEFKGIVINPNSAKLNTSSEISHIIDYETDANECTDESVRNKIYNKLVQIEKDTLG